MKVMGESKMGKILFVTRSYSKNKGGKEIYNFNLVRSLRKHSNVKLIASSGNIINLLWFYPYSFIKGFYHCLFNEVNYVHAGDAFMLPPSFMLSKIFNKKISTTLYGLDLTYPSKVYQSIFLPLIGKCDKIIAISKETRNIALTKGINGKKLKVIPCGINSKEFILKKSKRELRGKISNKFNLDLKGKTILLTSGRLVKRKGVEWFVSNVMPKLNKKYVYLISGDGKEKENIEKSIKKHNLSNRVVLLSRTDFQTLKELYNVSDVFIMPNIKVKGDMEGFGIVIIEAGSVGLPVVASKIEGIKDALIDKKIGYFVEEKDTNGFISKIKLAEKLDKKQIIKTVNDNFTWDKVARNYLGVLR